MKVGVSGCKQLFTPLFVCGSSKGHIITVEQLTKKYIRQLNNNNNKNNNNNNDNDSDNDNDKNSGNDNHTDNNNNNS